MKEMKIILAAILFGLIVTLTLGMVYLLKNDTNRNSFFSFGLNNGWDMLNNDWEKCTLQNTTKVDISEIKKIDINYNKTRFDMVLVPTEGNNLIVEEYFSREVDKDKLGKVNKNGNTLLIEQRYNTQNYFIKMNDRTMGYIKVYVPIKEYEKLTELEVSATSGNIELLEWDRMKRNHTLDIIDLASVSGKISASYLNAKDIHIFSNSGDLIMDELYGDTKLGTTSGDIEIAVIDGKKHQITTTSGNVKVKDIVGDAQLSSTSGDQRITSVKGNLDVSGTSGNQYVKDVTGNLSMGAVSGVLAAENLTGEGKFETTSGNISVSVAKWQGNINATSVSGIVNITLPEDSAFSFEANSVSGRISTFCDEQLSFNIRKTTANGTVGEKPDYHIKANTTSGNIKVNNP